MMIAATMREVISTPQQASHLDYLASRSGSRPLLDLHTCRHLTFTISARLRTRRRRTITTEAPAISVMKISRLQRGPAQNTEGHT